MHSIRVLKLSLKWVDDLVVYLKHFVFELNLKYVIIINMSWSIFGLRTKGHFWGKIPSKSSQSEVELQSTLYIRVNNIILIIIEKNVKKMFIFDYSGVTQVVQKTSYDVI